MKFGGIIRKVNMHQFNSVMHHRSNSRRCIINATVTVGFLLQCHTFKMVAWCHFMQKKW